MNIAARLEALAVGGWLLTRPTPVAAISAERVMTIKGPAIAALPLVNLSGDSQYDLFARGITDQARTQMTHKRLLLEFTLQGCVK